MCWIFNNVHTLVLLSGWRDIKDLSFVKRNLSEVGWPGNRCLPYCIEATDKSE